jgi:hypothetical protein
VQHQVVRQLVEQLVAGDGLEHAVELGGAEVVALRPQQPDCPAQGQAAQRGVEPAPGGPVEVDAARLEHDQLSPFAIEGQLHKGRLLGGDAGGAAEGGDNLPVVAGQLRQQLVADAAAAVLDRVVGRVAARLQVVGGAVGLDLAARDVEQRAHQGWPGAFAPAGDMAPAGPGQPRAHAA